MTVSSLLLDSAGQPDNGFVFDANHSGAKSQGDLYCADTSTLRHKSHEPAWFALRVTYCRELKLQERLNSLDIRTFVPMTSIRQEKNGKISRRQVSAVSNLIFVYSTRARIEEYMMSEGDRRMTHFMWDKVTRQPIIVPEKQMNDFIRICSESADDVMYLSNVTEKLRGGAKVRVKYGPFAGVEGTVVRLRKSRRILVEIPGLIAAASTYVPVEDLEVIG